ncbi:kinesin-like protein KIN-7O isoform X1 [Thunnus maccoyii]|uniref:kinesin-like protein KIN-7O isoform X1 n=1 Tax=Thunnus maccoyii TaxID=8240 RepID=UPI001C4C0025|nr:kinesin-like protein KIN-7O isoform X1 [Thunnus maccoyii]
MDPHQQTITPEAYECLLQAHYSLQQQNDVCSRNIQTLCQHNDSLMKHIESLYQTISSLSTENTALRRDYEALRTKLTDFKQNSDPSFTPDRKLEKEEENVVLNFHSAPVTEDAEDQSQKGSFLRGKKFWQVKEKGSLQQDKNEKDKDLNVCDMAVKCKVEKEEAMGRGKQNFGIKLLRLPPYQEAITGSEEQSLSAIQNRGENFLKTRTFWEVKEKGSSQKGKTEKEKDLNVCDMAVSCKVEGEEAMGRGKQNFGKKLLRPPSYHEVVTGSEEQSLSAFQSRGENFLKTRTFWESKQKGTSYQDKEPLEHINRRVPEEDMCGQELSMNVVSLTAEVESSEQDKGGVKEHENSTDLSDRSKEQEEEAEYQALLKELEDIRLQVATHQDLNELAKSNAEEEENKLKQLLKVEKDELDSLTVRNKNLIKDINSEREMTGVLNATFEDLEDQCGKLLLMNFLERNKHQKEMRSRREPELWQWEANRWGDSL